MESQTPLGPHMYPQIAKSTMWRTPVHKDIDIPPTLEAVQLGAWRIVFDREIFNFPSFRPRPYFIDFNIFKSFSIPSLSQKLKDSYVVRYLKDVYNLAPVLVVVYSLAYLAFGVEEALRLYCSNELYSAIEAGFISEEPDKGRIVTALAMRLLVAALVAAGQWMYGFIGPIIKDRIRLLFRQRVMEAHLRMDFLASQSKSNTIDSNLPQVAADALDGLLELGSLVSSTISQALVIMNVLKTQDGGFVLLLLCMAGTLLSTWGERDVWSKAAVLYVNDPWYIRLKAMYSIATSSDQKQEVAGGGLGEYVMKEYRRAASQSGMSFDDFPILALNRRDTPFMAMALALFEDFPLVYFAFRSITEPKKFTVASLAVLTQMVQTLRFALVRLRGSGKSWAERSSAFKKMYLGLEEVTEVASGEVPYPSQVIGHKDQPACQADGGMHISFQNVTFSYPGTDNNETQTAVRDVFFTLPSSSLVVIVGENGSGKSSLVKLLAGLYRPTAGDILIDGIPIREYRAADLTKATALLTQDYTIFPLSVAENIAVGDPDYLVNGDDVDGRVSIAAALGGATAFIEKLPKKFDEVLHPIMTSWSTASPSQLDGPLKTLMDEVERQKDVSGGEVQRLAAARTFMRLMSGHIKLVVVDEPTSAMDPSGEYELFQKLRSLRTGKTMVFVTHRFGHLTKHADIILCMKAGQLVESGTHRELIASKGEYQRLYDIQAKAFVDEHGIDAPQPVSNDHAAEVIRDL